MLQDAQVLDCCNKALSLIGNNCEIKSLQTPYESVEARSCARWFPACLAECLSKGFWTFARRDEVITDDYLTDYTSYPFKHTYRLPSDVAHIFSIASIEASSRIHSINTHEGYGHFDLRNIDNERYLATDMEPGFVINYQSNDVDLKICHPMFVSAVVYLLASKLSAEGMKGATGIEASLKFLELSIKYLQDLAVQDSSQGAYGMKDHSLPKSIRARL